MKSNLSLAEELRAIRNGPGKGKVMGPSKGMGPKPVPNRTESERPWQADIDRVQKNLQDVLQAISGFSGVDLPEADAQTPGDSFTRADFKNLKDRIRNDLETFSATTTTEISKKAEEQTRAALEAIQSEVSGQIQQLVGEYRQKLQSQLDPDQIGIDISTQARDHVVEMVEKQTEEFAQWVWLTCKGTETPIPKQVEKMIEPYVEEAYARIDGLIQQRVQEQLAQQEQMIQQRLQETVGSVEEQVSTLDQTARQICERNADSATKLSTERMNAAMEEAAKGFSSRINGETEGSLGRFQTSLQEMITASQQGMQQEGERQAEGFKQKLEGMTGEVEEMKMSEVSGRIEQAAAAAIASSVEHVQQHAHDAVEHSKEEIRAFLSLQVEEVRGQVQEVGHSVHESLSRDAAHVADSLKGLDQELGGIRDQHLAASQEQLSGMVHATVESLTARLKQIADAQIEEVGKRARESQDKAVSLYESKLQEVTESRYNDLVDRLQKEAGVAGAKVMAEIRAGSQNMIEELSEKTRASVEVLREEGLQASARIESMLKNSLETGTKNVGQVSETGFDQQRKVVADSLVEIQNRLRRAAEALIPASNSAY